MMCSTKSEAPLLLNKTKKMVRIRYKTRKWNPTFCATGIDLVCKQMHAEHSNLRSLALENQ